MYYDDTIGATLSKIEYGLVSNLKKEVRGTNIDNYSSLYYISLVFIKDDRKNIQLFQNYLGNYLSQEFIGKTVKSVEEMSSGIKFTFTDDSWVSFT